MASDDLYIPHITVVGVPDEPDDNNPSSSSSGVPSLSVDSSRLPPSPSTTARKSLDPLDSPTHTPHNSLLPPTPSPTLTAHSSGSILWANSTVSRDNDPEEHDGSCSLYLSSHPHRHIRKGSIGTVSSIGSSSTERDAEDNSSPPRSAHSDVTSTLPFPTLPHMHTTSDAGSRPSSVTGFIKRIMDRARRPSPPPSRDTDTGSDTTRNGEQKRDNADVKCKGAELARPAENESPTFVLALPSEFTDSSRRSRRSPPLFNSILESPPFPPTPTDPIPAEPQGPQSRVLVLLSICAVASLSLGLFRYFGTTRLKGILR